MNRERVEATLQDVKAEQERTRLQFARLSGQADILEAMLTAWDNDPEVAEEAPNLHAVETEEAE